MDVGHSPIPTWNILIDQVPYPTQSGQVGGHEGVGIVHKLGPGSENGRVKVGDRVGIKVSPRWGRTGFQEG